MRMAALSASAGVWRSLAIFLVLVILLQFYWIVSDDRHGPNFHHPPHHPPPPPPHEHNGEAAWSYHPERDANNHGLNRAQCDHAFPELYDKIGRAVYYHQNRGRRITQNDTSIAWRDDAAMRILIYDNQLRILEVKRAWNLNPYRSRVTYTLLGLYRALLGAIAAGEKLPNIEFAFVVDDMTLIPFDPDTHVVWGYTRLSKGSEQERSWLMPDSGFFASPPYASSWADMQLKAKQHDMPLSEKIPKLVWRGAIGTNRDVRQHLVNVSKDQPWSDVQPMVWDAPDLELMPMEDYCRYRFVAHTEGRSWSGRLKYLFNCNSLTFIHDLRWTTSYYHLLKPSGPDQNYVQVNREWSDLEEKITWYIQHPEEAQRVADNAVRTFRERYTSPAAEACYWRALIQGWSQVAFEPEPFEKVQVHIDGIPVTKKQLRGTAFEQFIYIPNDKMMPG